MKSESSVSSSAALFASSVAFLGGVALSVVLFALRPEPYTRLTPKDMLHVVQACEALKEQLHSAQRRGDTLYFWCAKSSGTLFVKETKGETL